MRADRLLSLLMLLQTNGRMTARELAQALEVSVRTIYRDMQALSTAGVPVYTEQGHGGGCCLIEDYRTELTGLTDDEAQALLLLSVPGPLDALDVGEKLKTALWKLNAARSAQVTEGNEVRPRIHLDWTWWGQMQSADGILQKLSQAVRQCRKLRLGYRLMNRVPFEQVVKPLGLVAKGGVWYLVFQANHKVNFHRVDHLLDVEILTEQFLYPPNFNLADYWKILCTRVETEANHFTLVAWTAPDARFDLARQFGELALTHTGEVDERGWLKIRVACSSLELAREKLMGFGRSVEVIEPAALRLSILDHAERILELYDQGEL